MNGLTPDAEYQYRVSGDGGKTYITFAFHAPAIRLRLFKSAWLVCITLCTGVGQVVATRCTKNGSQHCLMGKEFTPHEHELRDVILHYLQSCDGNINKLDDMLQERNRRMVGHIVLETCTTNSCCPRHCGFT